jgi:chemotaxis response regulator CheB
MSILLVDDSAAQRAALAAILAAARFRDLREAPSADAALVVLAAAAPGSIDLCLTDLYMPGGSGIEVCRRVWAYFYPPESLRRPGEEMLARAIAPNLNPTHALQSPLRQAAGICGPPRCRARSTC